MKFLADENIRREVISFLDSSGYDVVSTLKGSRDSEIAKKARKEKRIIVTHDNDFANRLLYPPAEFSGIVLIKIHPPTKELIIKALKNLFNTLSPSELGRKLVILEPEGFRIGS